MISRWAVSASQSPKFRPTWLVIHAQALGQADVEHVAIVVGGDRDRSDPSFHHAVPLKRIAVEFKYLQLAEICERLSGVLDQKLPHRLAAQL